MPFRQFFVSVSGSVNLPGRYPYVPDRTWEYYVNLAGGFDEDKNSFGKVDIIDVKGMRQSKTRLIQPEDSIVAATEQRLYIFGKYAAIITTILSLLTTLFIFAPYRKDANSAALFARRGRKGLCKNCARDIYCRPAKMIRSVRCIVCLDSAAPLLFPLFRCP